jgi:hypothetical protein
MKIEFVPRRFRSKTLAIVEKCNAILDAYAKQGFDMTVRQLFYQLVKSNEIANNQPEYDRLDDVVANARLAGLIDWDHIVDRTRSLHSLSTWTDPSQILGDVAQLYRVDKWEGQAFRPEVWIEKEALAGVFERVANEMEVPLFSCRGYTSWSSLYATWRRFNSYLNNNQTPYILHFGDHDPSGLDMTRDIMDRYSKFGRIPKLKRLALNIEQVEAYRPPPNFCKFTDSRARTYIRTYGPESWELDALQPDVLAGIVRSEIRSLIDADAWRAAFQKEAEHRELLRRISERFDSVVAFVRSSY